MSLAFHQSIFWINDKFWILRIIIKSWMNCDFFKRSVSFPQYCQSQSEKKRKVSDKYYRSIKVQYLRGPESTSIEIPPFRTHFIKFSVFKNFFLWSNSYFVVEVHRFLNLKEYFPNLLEKWLLCQIFVFWVRDFKSWLLAYFLIFFDCTKFQKDWTIFILDILQGSPLWCFFVFVIYQKFKGGTLVKCLI